MKKLHRARHAAPFALPLLLLGAIGCQSNIEDNTAFNTQVDRIDRTIKDIDAIARQIQVMDRDLQQVSIDVSNMVKSGGGGGAANPSVAALEQRILKLEGMMKTTSETVASFDARIKKIEDSVGSANTRVTSSQSAAPEAQAAAPSSDRTTLVISRRNESSGSTATKAPAASSSRSSSARETAGSVPAGIYHKVDIGETLESVAAKYGVTVAAIQEANQLPAGRNLVAGQQIYVPRAK